MSHRFPDYLFRRNNINNNDLNPGWCCHCIQRCHIWIVTQRASDAVVRVVVRAYCGMLCNNQVSFVQKPTAFASCTETKATRPLRLIYCDGCVDVQFGVIYKYRYAQKWKRFRCISEDISLVITRAWVVFSLLIGMLEHIIDHSALLYYLYCFYSVLNLVSLKFGSSRLGSFYNLIS